MSKNYRGISSSQLRRKKKKDVATHYYGLDTYGKNCHEILSLCYFCKGEFVLGRLTLEHLVPVSRGGARTDLRNLENACDPCNNLKGDMTVDEFIIKFSLPSYRFPRRGITTGEV